MYSHMRMVGEDGFEPTKPEDHGFTDRCDPPTSPLTQNKQNWFSRYDSNVDTKNQNLMSYQLDDRRINKLLFALSATSHLQVSRTEVLFWRSYIGLIVPLACKQQKRFDVVSCCSQVRNSSPRRFDNDYLPP